MGWLKGLGAAIAPFNPLLGGIAAVGGALIGNRANRNMARDQMRFQERMSGSAAQRSVEDFRAAGLNPGLAYGTTASTPMGSRAEQEDVMGRGLSTALNVKQAQAQIAATAASADKASSEAELNRFEIAKQGSTDGGTPGGQPLWRMQRDQLIRDLQQRAGMQPHELRSVKAAADMAELGVQLRKLDLPKAQVDAAFYKRFGIAIPTVGLLGSGAKAAADLSRVFKR